MSASRARLRERRLHISSGALTTVRVVVGPEGCGLSAHGEPYKVKSVVKKSFAE
jgi:hypothetical protein